MLTNVMYLSLAITLLPMLAGLAAGLCGKKLGRAGTHTLTICAVALAFALSVWVFKLIVLDDVPVLNQVLYIWGISGKLNLQIGFLIDHLAAMMMVVVTFVSLIVHIYSIGYMHDDPGYQRFFSYISLFTFAMLVLIMANNFLLLFFGWEAVGLVSYLLIGFWFKRESANQGSLKAFLVNRVGDAGFLLGIAAVFTYFNSVDYANVFAAAPALASQTVTLWHNTSCSAMTIICLLLFIGAMGKSAQVPLHVWLPESMEGPTPISALIHAATMVTAGIYLVARMSPLFEYSTTALSVVLIVGASGALFLGLVALVQYDIKRVVAYSTLSQLGYMMAALGASAYSAGLFHLFTHACFKALLFLAAGSVILALHHEQDMRRMGGLWRRMPITYITFLIGALALAALPPFAGFYSKDLIIEVIGNTHIAGASYAYSCVLLGTFVTALYIFRAFFLTFHGEARYSQELAQHLHESPWVVCVPLILLAIPSVILGGLLLQPLMLTDGNWFGQSLFVLPQHNAIAQLNSEAFNPQIAILDALHTLPLWLGLAGILTAWFVYAYRPQTASVIAQKFHGLYRILLNKYGFDTFNEKVWVQGTYALARWLYVTADSKVIDEGLVNGSGRLMNSASRLARRFQSGYLYHYALTMVVGLLALIVWLLLK